MHGTQSSSKPAARSTITEIPKGPDVEICPSKSRPHTAGYIRLFLTLGEIHGEVTVERMCELAKMSRAGFYRFVPRPAGPVPDLELRDALQRLALEFPSYGWPRMTAELQRRG